jgi:hypothetical protein
MAAESEKHRHYNCIATCKRRAKAESNHGRERFVNTRKVNVISGFRRDPYDTEGFWIFGQPHLLVN